MVDKKRDSDKLAKRIGKRIADRRKVLGWTQEQLAERVRVDAETISRFERGVNLPSLPTLERLAAALRVERDLTACVGGRRAHHPLLFRASENLLHLRKEARRLG